jgi:hypothetical protein
MSKNSTQIEIHANGARLEFVNSCNAVDNQKSSSSKTSPGWYYGDAGPMRRSEACRLAGIEPDSRQWQYA